MVWGSNPSRDTFFTWKYILAIDDTHSYVYHYSMPRVVIFVPMSLSFSAKKQIWLLKGAKLWISWQVYEVCLLLKDWLILEVEKPMTPQNLRSTLCKRKGFITQIIMQCNAAASPVSNKLSACGRCPMNIGRKVSESLCLLSRVARSSNERNEVNHFLMNAITLHLSFS